MLSPCEDLEATTRSVAVLVPVSDGVSGGSRVHGGPPGFPRSLAAVSDLIVREGLTEGCPGAVTAPVAADLSTTRPALECVFLRQTAMDPRT